jgi:hypothetical protein
MIEHKNTEQVIRYYLAFLPPHCESIINIGCGRNDPYGGILRNRCFRYWAFDIREGPKVDIVADITNYASFGAYDLGAKFDYAWCSETLEHIVPELKKTAVENILNLCYNAIFTYPGPNHPSFSDDPGHSLVDIDWETFKDRYTVHHIVTKTDRHVVILTQKYVDFFETKKLQKAVDKFVTKKEPKTQGFFK